MARLKQLHPSNYGFQGNTSNEFENIIRYLNAAEIGNLTLAELMRRLFDDEGNFDAPIDFRYNGIDGLQYRIGEYAINGVDQPEEGWEQLIPAEALRGPSGVSVGDIYAPVMSTRADFTATAAQTTFDVTLDDDTETLVYVNGILQRRGDTQDYTHQTTTDPTQIIFNAGLNEDDEVSVFRVTPPFVEGYTREDWNVDSDRTVFSFIFDENEKPLVYHNGVLQREGATGDYVLSPATNQILFNTLVPAGDDVTAILIENEAQSVVAGLMLEAHFVDPTTGFILGSKVQYEDDGIPQAKVASLVETLNLMASATESATEPDPPTLFWLDTSGSEPVMKYWTGVQYIPTSGSTGLPSFTPTDAGLFVKINGTGTGFTYGSVDLSGLIEKAQRGAANGVATLDANGRLTASQAPSPRERRVMWKKVDGSVADGDYPIGRFYLEKNRVLGFIGVLDGGTATAEITANGASISSAFSLSVTKTETALGSPVTIDSNDESTQISIAISGAAAATGLEVGVVVETVA